MSRQNQDSADAIAGCVIGILWAMTAGIIALVVKAVQTPPEVQLRRLGQTAVWGSQVESVTCTHCGGFNEFGRDRCFACGSNNISEGLNQDKRQVNVSGEGSVNYNLILIAVLILFTMLLCMFTYG